MKNTDGHNRRSAYRGDQLLARWLSGDITYVEEKELFDLAENDEVLQTALEGYIGQDLIARGSTPETVLRRLHPEQLAPKGRRVKRMVWLRYAAAAVVLIAAIGFLTTVINNSGQPDEPVIVDNDTPVTPALEQRTADEAGSEPEDAGIASAGTDVNQTGDVVNREAAADRTEGSALQRTAPAINTKDTPQHTFAEARETEVSEGGSELSRLAADQLAAEFPPVAMLEASAQESLLPDGGSDLSDKDGSGSFNADEVAETAAEGEEAPAEQALKPVSEREIALQFFDTEADEVLKREVQMEAIREGDQPITGYEFDIRTGVSPEEIAGGNLADAESGDEGVDQVGLQSKANLADAAGKRSPEDRTNMIASDVVITEYKIQKRDITHPPVEDFNSLVREKYKNKAKPESGFFSYKKYLKRATSCLVREHSNIATLEEAIIKFRVFDDGNIEFIELFGADASGCAEQISADITNGPKWQLAEHYESIDIEVPFKVLYPYWY